MNEKFGNGRFGGKCWEKEMASRGAGVVEETGKCPCGVRKK